MPRRASPATCAPAGGIVTVQRPADQLPLWWHCDICGSPHINGRDHRACGDAMDRWFRDDNWPTWTGQTWRAVL